MFDAIAGLGAAALQNPQFVHQAAAFAPRAPRAAAHVALRFAGISGDDAAALQESGVPAWALLLVGATAGFVLGAAVAKRYPVVYRHL